MLDRTLWAAVSVMVGCSGEPPASVPPADTKTASSAPLVVPEAPEVLLDSVRVDVLDPGALLALEANGWSLAQVMYRLGGGAVPEAGPSSLAWMSAHQPAWTALARHLQQDVDGLVDGIQRDLVVEHADAVHWPAGNVGRRLDTRWFRSRDAGFRLAGVVQRIDRRDLHAVETCGEVRFLFRLSYAIEREGGAAVGSRLPVLLNVVTVPTETDCVAWARRWAEPPTAEGVLDPGGLTLDRVEVNAQVVRFPAGVATEFGGQAAYLLETLALTAGPGGMVTVDRQGLENTPDVTRLRSEPELRRQLTAWIADNVDQIDQGTYLLPDRFLADRALSWSTLGVNRLVNRPFSAIFPPGERAGLPEPSDNLRQVGSVAGLLDRLDNGSCMGCHQAGSAAGFHLLGPDDPTQTGVTNRLAQVVSPHLTEERHRRRAATRDLANGGQVDLFRAHSLAPNLGMKGYVDVAIGQACPIPGDALAPAARWGCSQEAGPASCVLVARDPLSALNWGRCTPDSVAGLRAGMACRTAEVESRVLDRRRTAAVWGLHGYADRVVQRQRFDLPEDKAFSETAYNCRPPVLGVPLGRAYRRCTAEERSLAKVQGELGGVTSDICGVVGGSRFDRCVEGDFHACMEQIVGRGMVATCDAHTPCREDHVCQALPWQLDGVDDEAGRALAEAGIGFCTPTYFLFQLRLDGHPVPRL